MIVKINRTEEIRNKLMAEGKVSIVEMDPEEMKAYNERLREIMRESRYKQAMSWISAANVWVG